VCITNEDSEVNSMDKIIPLEQIVDRLRDGMSIAIGGFAGVGGPLRCIQTIADSGVKDLTLICVANCHPFAAGRFDVAPLFANRQVRKFITAHNGTNPEAMEQCRKGELEVEFFPMGTWIEKLRAGGAGLGGVLTPTGVGTETEEGKQKISVHGRDYLLEVAPRADLAFIKGFRADRLGNIQYRRVAMNTNTVVATAADCTIAEVNEIVEIGAIEPEQVGTPGLFIQSVVQGYTLAEQEAVFQELWTRGGILKPELQPAGSR
jgi:acetate CoA/acetoacetate CoA-transferase alpha subunit